MEIIHYLTAQVCKKVFTTDDYGIAICADSIRNFKHYNLEPLGVVGVCHSDIPMKLKKYYEPGQRLSVSGLLAEFWSVDIKAPFIGMGDIKGVPDILVIDKRMKGGLEPGFFDWLQRLGVTHQFSDSGDRKFTAKARFVQERPWYFGYGNFDQYKTSDQSLKERYPLTLDIINSEFKPHNWFFDTHNYPPQKREIIIAQYPESHSRQKFDTPPIDGDFVFLGDELRLSNINDIDARTLTWYHSEPENEHFGFLRINDNENIEYNYEDDDDDEVESTDLTLHWREVYNEEQSLLNQVMNDPLSGRPLNRWLVTYESVDGWWGEGYVVHTAKPSFVCSWGWVTPLEGQSMAAAINFGKDRCVAVCFSHSLSDDSLYEDDQYPHLMNQAVAAVVEYLASFKTGA